MSLYRMLRLRKCGVVISILMTFLFLLGFSKTLHCSSKTVVKMTGDDQEFDLANLSSTYMSQALWVNAMIKSSIQGSRRYFPRTAAVNPDLLESILPIVENHLRNQADLESFLAKPVINSHEYAYINVPSRTCAEDKPEILIVVPSAPSNFAKRQKVRDGGRGAYVRVAKNKAKLLFFAGRQSLSHPNTTIQEMLNKEAKKFGDIVQEDFEDKYKNIRLKAMSMLKWAVTQCAEAKFILRSDDDVKINITKVVSVMRKTKKRYGNFVLGRMRVQDHPKRGHGKGIPIDPQHPDNILTTHTHCLEDNKPIFIKDPFDPAVAQDENFLLMSWDRYRILPSGEEQEEGPLYEFADGSPIITSDKYVAYETWGLQVNDVTLKDTVGRYKATAILTTDREEKIVKIVVAKPPTLQSEKLDVTRVNAGNHTVTLSCGRFADLGHPPVSVRWKTETGTILPADYRDGYLVLTLSTLKEIGKVICVIDEDAPAAKCIPEVDKPRWKWKFPVTESFAGSSGGKDNSESGQPGAVVGVGIGVGVVTVVAAVVIGIYWYRRRLSARTVKRETPQHYERTQQTTEQHDHKALFTSADDYSLPTDTDSSAVTPNSPPMTTWQSAAEYVDVDDYYYERVKQVTQHQQRQCTDPKSGFGKRNNYANV